MREPFLHKKGLSRSAGQPLLLVFPDIAKQIWLGVAVLLKTRYTCNVTSLPFAAAYSLKGTPL